MLQPLHNLGIFQSRFCFLILAFTGVKLKSMKIVRRLFENFPCRVVSKMKFLLLLSLFCKALVQMNHPNNPIQLTLSAIFKMRKFYACLPFYENPFLFLNDKLEACQVRLLITINFSTLSL